MDLININSLTPSIIRQADAVKNARHCEHIHYEVEHSVYEVSFHPLIKYHQVLNHIFDYGLNIDMIQHEKSKSHIPDVNDIQMVHSFPGNDNLLLKIRSNNSFLSEALC